jgi:hypothetical protein
LEGEEKVERREKVKEGGENEGEGESGGNYTEGGMRGKMWGNKWWLNKVGCAFAVLMKDGVINPLKIFHRDIFPSSTDFHTQRNGR